MFSEGDIAKVNLNLGSSGFDPQIALAVTDHIALVANGSFQNNHADSSESFHRHRIIEGGIGYYTTFDKNGRFEFITGYGLGRVESYSDYSIFNAYANARFRKIFFQPAVGFVNEYFEGSLVPRFSMISMDVSDSIQNASVSRNYNLFFEPALIAKIGPKNIRFIIQAGITTPVGHTKIPYEYDWFFFSGGLQITLDRNLFKGSKEKKLFD